MPRSVPKVAHCDDYDSDQSSVKPGTRKEARRRRTNSRPPKTLDRYRSGHRDGASDSGYSSHTSGTQPASISATAQPTQTAQLPLRPANTQDTTKKSKPVLHRSESHQNKDKAPSRSASTSRARESCSDLQCQHAICQNTRNREQQQNAPQVYPAQISPLYAVPPQSYIQQASPYQYAYSQTAQVPATQTVPVLASQPQPRPRPNPPSRQARPVSFHGYPVANAYNSSNQGPPPSASAYQNAQYAAWVQLYQRQQVQAYQQAYGATAVNPQVYPQQSPIYPQQSPVTASPTSPDFRTASGFPVSYSTRAIPSAREVSAPQAPPPGLNRTYSTRQGSSRVSMMPGAYPGAAIESPEASSGSESSPSDYSEEEYERQRRSRARDSRLMSSSSTRRPSIKRQCPTDPVVPTRSSRDMLERNRHTDNTLDYISGSDNMDSDRTARAVVHDRPRTAYTNSSRSSRRPSLATTTSSDRTKATTVSNSSGLGNTIVERNGRQITYMSKIAREALQDSLQRETGGQRLEEANAYQTGMRGSQAPELTAENMLEHQRSRSRSNFSGHSRKTSRSSSRPYNHEVMQNDSGRAIIHVYPGSTVEVRPGKDGSSTLVIENSSGKEGSYFSGSTRRSSWGRGGSEDASWRGETIVEDDRLEQPHI